MNAARADGFTFDAPPTQPGRYLTLRRCAANACWEWFEPSVTYFDGTKWHVGGVIGWQGPIPVMRLVDYTGPEQRHLGTPAALEYDL